MAINALDLGRLGDIDIARLLAIVRGCIKGTSYSLCLATRLYIAAMHIA